MSTGAMDTVILSRLRNRKGCYLVPDMSFTHDNSAIPVSLNGLRAFECAARHQSFTEAARELGVMAWREPGLPGRYCPENAARAIFDALMRGGALDG